ncbi:MAG: uracil-DNA glycosylase [Bacteriovorax sp.]|nr:uracil-DNA glycosylase [Bacteriovorax sp.]
MTTLDKPLKDYLLDSSWKKLLKSEFDKSYMLELEAKLRIDYQENIVYPKPTDLFSAFNLTTFDNIKAVIIGQDPYHGPGQAHGLCFSVRPEVKIPPSLKNIYKEIESDLGIKMPNHGCLKAWAMNGVLLLNAHLTVEASNPMAHKNYGWDQFTDRVIELINEEKENIVFMLWGSPAHAKAKNVDPEKHCILKTVHPSPLSSYRGFFGSKHFSKCNQFLISKGIAPIDWSIPPVSKT